MTISGIGASSYYMGQMSAMHSNVAGTTAGRMGPSAVVDSTLLRFSANPMRTTAVDWIKPSFRNWMLKRCWNLTISTKMVL